MKVLCKRTYIDKIKKSIRWCKNKYYNAIIPNEIEIKNGVKYYIEIENENDMDFLIVVNKKDFSKYFIDIDDIRDLKIKQIIE